MCCRNGGIVKIVLKLKWTGNIQQEQIDGEIDEIYAIYIYSARALKLRCVVRKVYLVRKVIDGK